MDRRTFLKGLVATAAGVLVPGAVLAEPERRVWALDRTMVHGTPTAFITDDPMKYAFDIVLRWDDGFTQAVKMTQEQLYSGAKIQLARGGTLTGWHIAPQPDFEKMAVNLWTNPYESARGNTTSLWVEPRG